jgi:hypothetical protein
MNRHYTRSTGSLPHHHGKRYAALSSFEPYSYKLLVRLSTLFCMLRISVYHTSMSVTSCFENIGAARRFHISLQELAGDR